MREMTELTEILHGATERSLVLLDEVGRGTSTADGRALARAVTEFIHGEVGAFTLFATHFHGLTDVAADLEGVCNLHFTADRSGEEVRFVHAVVEGPADGSYGVDVARLAGVPTEVTERARELLEAGTETSDVGSGSDPQPEGGREGPDRRTNGHGDDRVAPNGAGGSEELADVLRELDIARMTPLEALNRLDELQRRVEDEE
jgi:DNA mismatch repair protein MutS